MFPALLCTLLLQTMPPAQPATLPSWTTAPPALAAKAIGKPGYGLLLETEGGRFLLTNLRYDLLEGNQISRTIRAYVILEPGGGGPYRYGFNLRYHAKVTPEKREHPDCEYADFFYPVSKDRHGLFGLEPGSSAEKAGFSSRYYILDIDGKTFGWNEWVANYYLSTHASVVIHATKCPLFFGSGSPLTFTLEGNPVALPNPEEWVIKAGSFAEVDKAVKDEALWAALVAAKEATPECAPLTLTLEDGRRALVIRNPWGNVTDDSKSTSPLFEFWESTPTQYKLIASVPTPIEGRFVKLHDRWYRIQGARLGPDSRRLEAVNLEAWTPDVPTLLAGRCPTQTGTAKTSDREGIEQAANQALLAWKTRSLPDQLAAQNRGSAEDLVLSLEQGLLTLDLDVKGIRSRLDVAARAEAERKAQAELAARDGKAAPPMQARPITESERLADLLEQRKAILMAILGSAKQSLANLRR